MAIKHRLSSDDELAHAHDSGASVTLMQMVEHRRLGTVLYAWPKHWAYHVEAAEAAFESLERLHEELAAMPVGPDAMRSIDDIEFIGRVYKAGSTLVSEVVRTLQHLCEEIERWTGTPMGGSTIETRFAGASAAAGLENARSEAGYSAFQEIHAKRDAIEHPKPENIYNDGDTTWDEVPLAWFMSDRVIEAYRTYVDWFVKIADRWEATKAAMPGRPATFEVEMRGLRSDHQFKKPPRSTNEPD